MARKFKTMDGNNAAAYVSYAFTEICDNAEFDFLRSEQRKENE